LLSFAAIPLGASPSTVATEEKGEIMGGQSLGASPYGTLHHIGVVVRDMDKAIAHFESMGFGPFQFSEGVRTFTIDFTGELHGEPAEWKVKISNAKIGDIELELLEPDERPSALRETLDATGEGIHHILSDDFEGDMAGQLARGATIWTMSKRTDAPSFLFFEPSSVGGMAIELRTPGED
jgi:methylmalonyl-CoA/ethylmalonyl-CoA epimerase